MYGRQIIAKVNANLRIVYIKKKINILKLFVCIIQTTTTVEHQQQSNKVINKNLIKQ